VWVPKSLTGLVVRIAEFDCEGTEARTLTGAYSRSPTASSASDRSVN
jgi:hypothetical protein